VGNDDHEGAEGRGGGTSFCFQSRYEKFSIHSQVIIYDVSGESKQDLVAFVCVCVESVLKRTTMILVVRLFFNRENSNRMRK